MIHDTFRYSCGLKHTKFKIQSPFKNFPIVQNVNYIQKYNTFFKICRNAQNTKSRHLVSNSRYCRLETAVDAYSFALRSCYGKK